MTVTSYSLLSAVMWSSVFIVLLYFMRKNTRLLAFFGATPLLLLGLGISLRCYFPFDWYKSKAFLPRYVAN